jgi:excisionase family DNA binding protein
MLAQPGLFAIDPGQMVTVAQAAELLAVDWRTVRRRVADGTIPAYRVAGNKAIRIRKADLALIAERIPTVGGAA